MYKVSKNGITNALNKEHVIQLAQDVAIKFNQDNFGEDCNDSGIDNIDDAIDCLTSNDIDSDDVYTIERV